MRNSAAQQFKCSGRLRAIGAEFEVICRRLSWSLCGFGYHSGLYVKDVGGTFDVKLVLFVST
jgi:hypothetical protein